MNWTTLIPHREGAYFGMALGEVEAKNHHRWMQA